MKPAEIYALPDISSSPWYDTGDRVLEDAFGLDLYGQLDRDRAEEDGDARLTVHEKLHCFLDYGERTAAVQVLSLDGKPFGIHRAAGRGQEDFRDFVATDRQAYAAALDHLRTYQIGVPDLTFVDPAADLDGLGSFYGATVLKHEGDVLLVRNGEISRDGRLLFDTRRYKEAFDRLVRPLPGAFEKGLGSPDVLPVFAEALATGVPSWMHPVVVAEEGARGDWIGVVMSTDEGSYSIGLPSYARAGRGFSAASSLSCGRIGGPEIADAFREARREVSPPR